jgi:hypothetical protein
MARHITLDAEPARGIFEAFVSLCYSLTTVVPDARNIDDVIARLGDIVTHCRRANSRLGYFPALYRKVTIQVKEDIATGRFEDGARMERLDVRFANRYFEAFDQHRRGKAPTRSWAYSFARAESPDPLILQHLMLGINAHINLDLGIAAVETAPAEQLPALRTDFERINTILAALVDTVQDEIATLWPAMGVIDRLGGRLDEALCNFCLAKARVVAWTRAEELAASPKHAVPEMITRFDDEVCALSRRICPDEDGLWSPLLQRLSAAEDARPRAIIDVLV